MRRALELRHQYAGKGGLDAVRLRLRVVPFVGSDYWVLIATRAAIYWTLVSGLTLVVGFAGQLAIGYVALLTLGAYVTSVLAAGDVLPPVPTFIALAIAGAVGSVFGVVVGLPALRLRTFYFAMTTLGFATIVTQIALAWQDVTGGGIGLPSPELPAPFNTTLGLFYPTLGLFYLCLAIAATCTWMVSNIAASRFGRALIAIRDADVAAEATGIAKPPLLVALRPRFAPTRRWSVHTSADEPLLDIRALEAGYGKIPVLRSVDLHVRRGEVVRLLGPNGAGKTTLLRAISGLLPIGGGSVQFDGHDISGTGPRESSRVGLAHVIEGHRVFTQQTVADNQLLAAYNLDRRERNARIEEACPSFPKLSPSATSLARH